MSVAAALADGIRRLTAAGVDDPARDARRLMAHLAPGSFPSDDLPDPAAWEAALALREARRPVAQIVGRRSFWRHEFEVTVETLDPRPDTETLVEAALEVPFDRILDLGTGTGCILLSLLAERPAAHGTGTDQSNGALAVAARNAARIGVAGRARLVRADWWDGVAGIFDLVVSNPPYIAEAEMADLSPEVLHEPRAALTPGGDGLDAYRAICAGIGPHLSDGGWLMVEIGPTQGAEVAAEMRAAGLRVAGVRPDLDGRDRIVIGQKMRA